MSILALLRSLWAKLERWLRTSARRLSGKKDAGLLSPAREEDLSESLREGIARLPATGAASEVARRAVWTYQRFASAALQQMGEPDALIELVAHVEVVVEELVAKAPGTHFLAQLAAQSLPGSPSRARAGEALLLLEDQQKRIQSLAESYFTWQSSGSRDDWRVFANNAQSFGVTEL